MTDRSSRQIRVYSSVSLNRKAQLEIPVAAAKHLLTVLRLQPGDAFILFDGLGRDYQAQILQVRGSNLVARIGPAGELEPMPILDIELGVGISKGERMDFAIQKAVELGVSRITPIWTSRSMVKLDGQRLARRLSHWQGVVVSACEQSGRRRLPSVNQPLKLAPWLALRCANPHELAILLDHRADELLCDIAPPASRSLSLLVGPEGGLSSEERAMATSAGFKAVRLGPRIMRTETAPLAAIAAIQTLWGDFCADENSPA